MYVDLNGAYAFLLIFLRMTGLIVLNPIFARQNVPTMTRTALAFLTSILLVGQIGMLPPDQSLTLLQLAGHAVFEMSIGLMAGVLFRMFMSVLLVGGESIDMEIGISMAKAFDPGSNTSISTTANFLTVMFYLVFFATNSHYTFMRMAVYTFYILPLGSTALHPDAFYHIAGLLSTCLTLAIKLSAPVIVIEVIVTMAIGIIMRIVPQINIFVVNIQFKLLVGLIVLLILVPSFVGFIETLITLCFEHIGNVLMEAGRP